MPLVGLPGLSRPWRCALIPRGRDKPGNPTRGNHSARRCSYRYDGTGAYNYLIVHQTDPRYTGNPDWAIWDTWEYHVLTESGSGNLVRPESHVGS